MQRAPDAGSVNASTHIGFDPKWTSQRIPNCARINSSKEIIVAKYSINVNGSKREVDALPDTPLLWVLRDNLELTGAKFGCGQGTCGCCTVLVDGRARKSCIIPISTVADKKVVTIEGLSKNGDHPVQAAWMEEDVPQCGYCQAGQIMAAVSLLKENKAPTDEDIDDAMGGNWCRCGTYDRIRKAIHTAAKVTK